MSAVADELVDDAGAAAPLDLSHLAAEAAALDGAPQPGAAAAPQVDLVEATRLDLLGTLEFCRSMAAPPMAWWPQFGIVWSDATLKAMALNGALVMVQYGWSISDVMSKWGPVLGLAAAVIPAAVATYAAIKQRRLELAQASRTGKAPDGGQKQTAD